MSEVRYASEWYVWIVAVSDSYIEQLVGRLVSHGWQAQPLSENLVLKESSGLPLLALKLAKVTKAPILKGHLMSELKETMKLLGMSWVSIIITASGVDCTWSAAALPEAKKDDLEENRIIN